MSHFEVSEESAADRTDKTLVASFCLTDDLFLVRFKQISRPYSKFALCQSQFSQFVILKYSMLDQPNPEKKQIQTN